MIHGAADALVNCVGILGTNSRSPVVSHAQESRRQHWVVQRRGRTRLLRKVGKHCSRPAAHLVQCQLTVLPGADTFGRQYRFTPKAALLREYTREVVSFCQTGTRSHATEVVLLGCRSEGMQPSTHYEARASRRLWKHGGWPSWPPLRPRSMKTMRRC